MLKVFVQHLAAQGVSWCVTGALGGYREKCTISTGFSMPEMLVLCWEAAAKGKWAVLVLEGKLRSQLEVRVLFTWCVTGWAVLGEAGLRYLELEQYVLSAVCSRTAPC